MSQNSSSQPRRGRSKILLILTSIYGLLYIIFIASGSYGSAGSEPTVVMFLFLLFLVGYAVVWWNERLGGVVFALWWAGMWYLALFVAQEDRGAGVVMGVPLFILAILFIISWYRRRGQAPGRLDV
jgi:drug/metabolite transporter (DMT)-like permease